MALADLRERRSSHTPELKASKQNETSAEEKSLDEKSQQLAETDTKCAEANEQLEDQKFIIMLNKTCDEGDKDCAPRKKNRMDGIKAILKTIEVINGDDFRVAINTTCSYLLQREKAEAAESSRTIVKAKRWNAAKMLLAEEKSNPDLSILAPGVQLDAFYKVKQAMDDMIATLKQQQADEVKKDEYCDATIQANEIDTELSAAGPELANALSEATEIRTAEKEKGAQAIADAKAAIAPDSMEASQKEGSSNQKKRKKNKKQTRRAPLSDGSDEKEKISKLWAEAVEPTDAPT